MAKKQNKKTAEKIPTPAPAVPKTPGLAFSPVFACLLVVCAIVTWVVYQGAFDNQFVSWDDPTYVQENPILSNPTPANVARLDKAIVSNNYHPLTMRTLLWDVQRNGLKAGPIIRTNVWLHLLNTCLVLAFVWLLTRGRWIVAGFTALLFALHPMHVESVVWVSERKDVLYVFFGLLSLLSYLQYVQSAKEPPRTSRWAWLALTLVLFLMACLSKAMAVVFPVLYLLVDYWEGRNGRKAGVWLEKIPFFALSLLFGLIALKVQKGQNFNDWFEVLEVKNALTTAAVFTPFQKLAYASYGLFQYCLRLFGPFGLCTYYPYPPKNEALSGPYLASVLFLAVYAGALVWSWRKQQRALFFGLAFALVSVALVLQFISVGAVIMADRYTYLPYVGLLFALGWYLDAFVQARPALRYAVVGLMAAFVLFCAVLTTRQIETWQDSISLWSRVIELYPNTASPYAKRGNVWGKEHNDLAKARADFEKAIQLDPNDAYAYEGLGIVAGMMQDHTKALEMFDKCVQLEPNYFNFYYNRAMALMQSKQYARSIPDFEKALQLNPGNYLQFVSGYAYALLASGDAKGARAKADEAVLRGMRDPGIYMTRAQALRQLGDIEGAKGDLQRVLGMQPGNTFARQLLDQLNQTGR